MGYFSNLAIGRPPDREDHSLIPRRAVLQWRLEDLRARMIELMESGKDSREHVAQEDLRYALPEELSTAEDVRQAMAFAQKEFWAECGFAVNFSETVPALAPEYEQTAPVCRNAPAPRHAA